jgi:hypothetical protein
MRGQYAIRTAVPGGGDPVKSTRAPEPSVVSTPEALNGLTTSKRGLLEVRRAGTDFVNIGRDIGINPLDEQSPEGITDETVADREADLP